MPQTQSNETLVKFEHIRKSYDGQTNVVKDLNLDIKQGEFLTMLGPSGSGKTTCLMMLAGFETPSSGSITLAGKPLHTKAPHKRGIGMVFQNYALFPHMTVAENLAFPLKVRRVGKSEIEAKVKKALDMVELGSLGGRFPGQMSGGQQQRIALARALVFEPQLVLMDEPLGALDKQLREHVQLEIKHIHDRLGVTIVYVTHDQGEALTMSDRIAVFHKGEIQQIESPTSLYEAPKNSFVASFIGENNLLAGTLLAKDGDSCDIRLQTGEVVKALQVNAGALNSPVSISIRPERATVSRADSSHQNQINGKIEEFIYLGDHIRIRISAAGSSGFTVKQPIDQWDSTLRKGDAVKIGWSAQFARALDPIETLQ